MKSEWDDHADEWDSNKDTKAYSLLAYESLSKIVDIENLNIVDFGCGTGLLTERLIKSAKSVVAIDSSEKMIDVLKAKNLQGVRAISEELSLDSIAKNDLENSSFDLVVASSVLGFIPDYESTVELLKSLLVKQGFFVQWDWLSPSDNPDFGLSKQTVKSILLNIGFINISVTVPFSMSSPEGDMSVLMAVAQKP